MHTVLRITGDLAGARVAAASINAVSDGAMSPRARGDGFVASISDADTWSEHVRALAAFVAAHREALVAASEAGLSLDADTMVEADDVAGRPITSLVCPPHLLRELGAVGASLTVSWYETRAT